MKKVLKWLCAGLAAMLFTATVYAAEGALTVDVPVEITVKETTSEGEEVETTRQETFTVELEAVTEGAPLPGGATGSYTEDVAAPGSLTFSLEFEAAGVYEYTIRQTNTEELAKNGWTMDETEYTMTVYVTHLEDSFELQTQVVLSIDGETDKPVEVSFENTYVQAKPAKWDPPVEKLVSGDVDKIPAGTTYTFAMMPDDPEAPMPENEECYTDETGALYLDTPSPGSYEFEWMYFDESHVGKTYTYTVKEIKGKDDNFEYDPVVYTMTIVVTEEDREVKLDVTYSDPDGKEVDKMSFTNKYTKPNDSEPDSEPDITPTGDNAKPFLWGGLAVLAAGGMAAAIIINRKKDESKE